MKPSLVIRALATAVKANKVVYLEGPPGVGKTSFPKQAAQEMGYDCIVWPPCPTLDPVDIRGAIKVITPADAEAFNLPTSAVGTTVAFPPDFLPRSVERPTIIVIDDAPTGSSSVQATLFQLLLERRLGTYTVPKDVHFVLTGNRLEDRAGAGRTLTALDSRVVRLSVEVSVQDWLDWAVNALIAPEVIAFHRFHAGKYLWQFDSSKKCNPLPRTWEFLSDIFKCHPHKDLEHELYGGCVGEEASSMFIGFLRIFRELPDPRQCLSNPTSSPVPQDIGAILCLCGVLSRIVQRDTLKNLITYTSRLGLEYANLAITDAVTLAPALKESKEYINWFRENSATFTK